MSKASITKKEKAKVEKEEAEKLKKGDQKIERSKSSVYQRLGQALNPVSQASLRQIGIMHPLSNEQVFEKIRERQNSRGELI